MRVGSGPKRTQGQALRKTLPLALRIMNAVRIIRRNVILGLTFFAAAWVSVTQTRLDGGVALVWGASAILIAALLRTPTRNWGIPLAVCGGANILVTGLWGLGWSGALPMALINLGEAALAAFVLRRMVDPGLPMQSLGWFNRFVLAVGIVGPLALAPFVGLLMGLSGYDPWLGMVHFAIGHGLGNLALTPIAMLLTGRRRYRETIDLLRDRWRDAIWVLPLTLGAVVFVFSQTRWSMMFLPVIVVVLATFRLGRTGAAIGIVMIAAGGGIFTAHDHGPVWMMGLGVIGTVFFFQFYLVLTALTVLAIAAELHDRSALLRRICVSEERFRMFAEHSSDLLMHLSPDGSVRFVSPSIRQFGGLDPEAMIGTDSADFVHPDDRIAITQEHRACLAMPGIVRHFRHRVIATDGSIRWCEAHARAIMDQAGAIDGVISIVRDVTDQRSEIEQLEAAALTDSLTGLTNRRGFERKVGERVRQSRVSRDCLAIFDLDNFKQVNDLYGHAAGDAVLCAFARLANQMLRHGDTVARLGGEEFVVLFPDTGSAQAAEICERLRRRLGETRLAAGGSAIRVTVSGGIAAIGPKGLEAALRMADAELYRAKNAGRDQLSIAA